MFCSLPSHHVDPAATRCQADFSWHPGRDLPSLALLPCHETKQKVCDTYVPGRSLITWGQEEVMMGNQRQGDQQGCRERLKEENVLFKTNRIGKDGINTLMATKRENFFLSIQGLSPSSPQLQ